MISAVLFVAQKNFLASKRSWNLRLWAKPFIKGIFSWFSKRKTFRLIFAASRRGGGCKSKGAYKNDEQCHSWMAALSKEVEESGKTDVAMDAGKQERTQAVFTTALAGGLESNETFKSFTWVESDSSRLLDERNAWKKHNKSVNGFHRTSINFPTLIFSHKKFLFGHIIPIYYQVAGLVLIWSVNQQSVLAAVKVHSCFLNQNRCDVPYNDNPTAQTFAFNLMLQFLIKK